QAGKRTRVYQSALFFCCIGGSALKENVVYKKTEKSSAEAACDNGDRVGPFMAAYICETRPGYHYAEKRHGKLVYPEFFQFFKMIGYKGLYFFHFKSSTFLFSVPLFAGYNAKHRGDNDNRHSTYGNDRL